MVAQAVCTLKHLAARSAESVFKGTAWGLPLGQPLSPQPRAASQTSPASAAKGEELLPAQGSGKGRGGGTGPGKPFSSGHKGCSPLSYAQHSSLHGYKKLKDPHTLPTPHRIFRELLENHTCCQLTKPANYTIC